MTAGEKLTGKKYEEEMKFWNELGFGKAPKSNKSRRK